jgi:poly(A) polymerase
MMTSPKRTEREFALAVVRQLREAGHEALWAGGCVRDELLGIVPKDYDIATSARPREVRRLFARTAAVGESFGVIEVIGDRPSPEQPPHMIQVATFRIDEYGEEDEEEAVEVDPRKRTPGRHPKSVRFCSAEEDARRRDFTINGMFFDPVENRLIDYVGGQADLAAKVLRAIGDPHERFTEDKLRMLRGVRFAARFELTLEPATASAISQRAGEVSVCSPERIAEELRKMLTHRHRARAMRLFLELGLARPVLPDVLPMVGLPWGPPRPDTTLPPPGESGEAAQDLWTHILAVLDRLPETPTVPLAFAALLHDIGKPRTVGRTPDRYTFHGHEHVGRRMAHDICKERLKMSNDEVERIEWLVEKHQALCDVRQMRTSKVKMLLGHPGITELLALHRADAEASGRAVDHVEYCEGLLREWNDSDLHPKLLLNGHDLQRAGLTPGPLFKTLLDALLEAQLEGTVTSVDQAWALLRPLIEQSGAATEEQRPC